MPELLNHSAGPDQPGPTPTGPTQTEPAPKEAAHEPSSGSGPRTAVKTRPSPPRVDRLPPYRVLLHNDDVNTFDDVIDSLVELTPLNYKHAQLVALEADATGVALILITHKERAELYRDQFRSKTINVTIETAE